jgi:hypothetical protein
MPAQCSSASSYSLPWSQSPFWPSVLVFLSHGSSLYSARAWVMFRLVKAHVWSAQHFPSLSFYFCACRARRIRFLPLAISQVFPPNQSSYMPFPAMVCNPLGFISPLQVSMRQRIFFSPDFVFSPEAGLHSSSVAWPWFSSGADSSSVLPCQAKFSFFPKFSLTRLVGRS